MHINRACNKIIIITKHFLPKVASITIRLSNFPCMAKVIICVSLITLMSILPLSNTLELTDDYVKWAEGRVTGRPCGQGVQCDLRHQYCDIVMETCRPCTELCRTWDAPEDMDICNKHCAGES